MENTINLEKRVKRHVLGRQRSFYVSALPGLEHLCADELSALGDIALEGVVEKGGVAFAGRVHDGYAANLMLRTANRVLMRLDAFEAQNFRQLEKKARRFPWELYLGSGANVQFHATSRQSRLIHTEAIAGHFREAVAQRLQPDAPKNPGEKRYCQQIFVRCLKDHFIVSLDSSGDLLHRRGLKAHGGAAPIRETIAAAILMTAGFRAGDVLVDPMCGSGTFSLEGAMMASHIPAGWYREFAFMDWPCFRPARWGHIRAEAGKMISPPLRPLIFASDIDRQSVELLEQTVGKKDLSQTLSVAARDFFELSADDFPAASAAADRLVVINPPYGKRLAAEEGKKFFIAICRKLKSDFSGFKFALIVPDRKIMDGCGLRAGVHPLFHGGLQLSLLTGRVD